MRAFPHRTARLFFAALLLSLAGRLVAGELSTEQWRPVEIALAAAKPHPDPFYGVDVTATFTGPGGIALVRPAFWDGGNVWKIRFAPTAPGAWTYTTACSDPADPGLQGQQGQIACVPYAGNLEIYRHGFLRVADDRHRLAYRDGTPFFWLGDTHWLLGKERLEKADRPGWTSEFRGMADRRAAQGFTIYQVEFFGDWDASTSGRQPDLARFRDNYDPKIAYLADRGLVVAATLGILNPSVTPEQGLREARMARYVSARYGAYPMTWLMYQECTANRPNKAWSGNGQRGVYMDAVRDVGRIAIFTQLVKLREACFEKLLD